MTDYLADFRVFDRMPDTATKAEIRAAIEADRATRVDDALPPWWDRSVHVLHQTSMHPWQFRVWCGECHTMISSYDDAVLAAVALHRHLDHGGHRTMPTQKIQTHAVTEALVEFVAEQTGETDAFDVRLTAAGDDLIVTYKIPDDTELVLGYRYAALTVDADTRALIEAATA